MEVQKMALRPNLIKVALTLLILAFALLVAQGQSIPGLRMLELYFQDVRVSLLSKELKSQSNIVVVEINERTFAKLEQRSPIERHFLAQLIRDLNQSGAKAIGVDILIDQATNEAADDDLLNTIKESSIPLFFAYADAKIQGVTIWQHQYQQVFFDQIYNPRVKLVDVRLTLDSDNTIRRHSPNRSVEHETMSSALALEANIQPQGQPFLIDFIGKQTTRDQQFNTISADLIDSSVGAIWSFQKKFFKDKLVLIGVNSSGVDRYKTPFSTDLINGEADTAGVFVHAYILSQYIDGRNFPSASNKFLILYALFVVSMGFILGFYVNNKMYQLTFLISAPLIIWFIGFYFAMPTQFRIFLPMISPSFGFIATYFFASGLQKRKFQKERNYTRKVLKHYVAQTVLDELDQHPEKLSLGGERKKMSFIFTDIANFTTFSETNPPEVVTDVLNRYLSGMSHIVHQHEGTIDKYIGDAVVAFWGAPLDDSLHAQHALSCSLEMHIFSENFRISLQAKNLNFGHTRIGVHSGLATIGNFGGSQRYDYTAIGDTVNTTARIEGANKYFNSQMLVSEDIVKQAIHFEFRLVGDVILKGKQKPLTLYEPVLEKHKEYHSQFTDAIMFLQLDKEQAKIKLTKLITLHPDDELIRFHLQRLTNATANEPIMLQDK